MHTDSCIVQQCVPDRSLLYSCRFVLLQLLDTLKRCKLKARLSEARARMQQLFPLNEGLWLDWINDTMANISTQEDADAVKQLFQQATQDYVSVNIWESYLQ